MVRTILLVVLLGVSGAGFAQTLDYNYIEGHYGQVDFDDANVDGDGFGLGGSFAVSDNFHVFGSYTTADLDGVDVNQFDAGIGYNTAVSDSVDVVARLGYVSTEVELPLGLGSVDDDGYGVGVGLRGMMTPVVELHGDITYVDLGGDSDGDTSFGAGFLYHFSDAFAAGLSGDWDDNFSRYQLTGRMSFGR